MAIAGGIIVVSGIEKIKLLNSVVVPLIILSIFIIFLKLDPQNHSAGFSIAKPILYSGLDVLLGGVIISEEGKKMSHKEILLSCSFICICLFAILFMLQTVVLSDELHSSMPVLAVAEKFNLKVVCGILIAGAIFTTLVSSLKILSDRIIETAVKLRPAIGVKDKLGKSIVVFFCILIAFPISFLGFDNIVDTMYPFISWCGVALTAFVILKLIVKGIFKAAFAIKRKKRSKSMNESSANTKAAENGGCVSAETECEVTRIREDYDRSTRRYDGNARLHDYDSRSRRDRSARRRDCDSRSRRNRPHGYNRDKSRPDCDSRPRSRRRTRDSKYLQTEICGRRARPSL